MLFAAFAWPGAGLRAADDAGTPKLAEPPDAAAQSAASKEIRNLFSNQIDAAKTNLAKDELAKKLLQQGIESKVDPPGQFVLFQMARDLAVGVGDLPVALQSIDETARAFHFDTIPLRQETLAAFAKTQTNPLQSRTLADATWSALDAAIAADNFDAAKLLAPLGLAAAKRGRDADMLRQWTTRAKEIDDLEAAYDAVRPALTRLAQKPLDPAANLAVGRYRILIKGDWDQGLSMIALGTDSPMQALAIAEMSPPEEPEAQLKLADAWWELADGTVDASEKDRLQGRALYWYGQALPNLTGLPKTKVEKRLQDLNARMFDRVRAAVRGKKVLFSAPVGMNRGGVFLDSPEEGGLLVGFEIGLGNNRDGGRYIRAIRPLFITARRPTEGLMHGNSGGDVVTIRAREGYAVAGLTLKAPNRIEGLSVTFMQIQGIALNPRNAYTSDWYGGHSSGVSIRLGGSGTPMIGIGGKADNSLQELALIQIRG